MASAPVHPPREAALIPGPKTPITVRGSPAPPGIALLIPRAHEMDPTLRGCHVHALHEPYIPQARKPLAARTRSTASLASRAAVRGHGVKTRAQPPLRGHRQFTGDEFPYGSRSRNLMSIPQTQVRVCMPTQNPQIPLKWSRTMPTRVKGK